MDGYENENLSCVLLIEQAGVVFGIRFGTFTPDAGDSPLCPVPDEDTKEQST